MRRLLVFALAAALVPQGLIAGQKPPKAPPYLAASLQPVVDGRAVMVELAQPTIGTEIDIGRVAPDMITGGGLEILFWDHQDTKPLELAAIEERKAEGLVLPLRKALDGLDLGPVALATTTAALGKVGWFGAREPRLARVSTEGERAAFAAISETGQFAVVSYSYTTSPDFTQIRVYAEITIWQKAAPAKGGKPTGPVLLSRHRVLSLCELRKRSFEQADNVKAWSADGGKLARAALSAAFARLEVLIPRALAMTPLEHAALIDKKRPKVFAAGFYGPRVEGADEGTTAVTIWSNALISAMPAPGS